MLSVDRMTTSRRYRKQTSSISAAPRAGSIHPVAGRYYQALRHLNAEHKRAVLRALDRRLYGTTALSGSQELVAWWWARFRALYGREPAATLWDKKRKEDEAFADAPSSMTVRTAFGDWASATERIGSGEPTPDPLIREKLAVGPKYVEDGELRVLLDACNTGWREPRPPEKEDFLQWLSDVATGAVAMPAGIRRVPNSFSPFDRAFTGWSGCLKVLGLPVVRRRHRSGPGVVKVTGVGALSNDELIGIAMVFAQWQAGPLSSTDFAEWLRHPRAPLGVALPALIPTSYETYRARIGGFDEVLRRAGLEQRIADSTAARATNWHPSEVTAVPANTPAGWPASKRDDYWMDAATLARRGRISRREYARLRNWWKELARAQGLPEPEAPHGGVISKNGGGWTAASSAAWRRTKQKAAVLR